jgi:prefoldin subunit 5
MVPCHIYPSKYAKDEIKEAIEFLKGEYDTYSIMDYLVDLTQKVKELEVHLMWTCDIAQQAAFNLEGEK